MDRRAANPRGNATGFRRLGATCMLRVLLPITPRPAMRFGNSNPSGSQWLQRRTRNTRGFLRTLKFEPHRRSCCWRSVAPGWIRSLRRCGVALFTGRRGPSELFVSSFDNPSQLSSCHGAVTRTEGVRTARINSVGRLVLFGAMSSNVPVLSRNSSSTPRTQFVRSLLCSSAKR